MNDQRIDTPRTRAIGRRLRKAMDDILAEARANGIAEPRLFFEAEGGVYVMDGASADYVKSHLVEGHERQRAIRVDVCKTPHGADVGAW